MTTLDTIYLKDAYGNPFPAAVVPIGASSGPLNAAAHVLLDQYGDALATPNNPLLCSPLQLVAVANFTRPSNSTPYTDGALIANSASAGSVVPLAWTVARVAGGSLSIVRARLKKSSTTIFEALMRLHLYSQSPTPAHGDGGLWLTPSSGYIGSFTFDFRGVNSRVFSDSAKVIATPDVGALQIVETVAPSQQIYGLLEYIAPASGDTYTPAHAEVFTGSLEVTQN
jgi:hypothetical protein